MTVMPGWIPTAPAGAYGWQSPPQELDVTFGSFRFVTGATPEAEAVRGFATISEWSGWDEPAPDATDSIDHWSGDGSRSGMQRYGARVVQIRGALQAPNARILSEARDRLLAQTGVFAVNERDRLLSREVNARITAYRPEQIEPDFEQYTLTLRADDPLRYLSAVQPLVSGANVLLNPGNREAWPTLELTGPHGAISIVHPGGTWSLTSLGSGVTRIVDLREGEVWEGGVRVFGKESGPAPRVPAGGTSWTVSGLGAGAARVRRFGAWS